MNEFKVSTEIRSLFTCMLRVLICPLNWGLGHATRCRPIIDLLTARGHEVHLAGDGLSIQILKTNYPAYPVHSLAPLNIQYGTDFWARLMVQIPTLIFWVVKDKIEINRLQKLFQFDLIISDSRPGCTVSGVSSVFIINQPSPIIPIQVVQWLVHRVLRRWYKRIDRLWIPDQEGDINLSGKLIELPSSVPTKRIGFLSVLENEFSEAIQTNPGKIVAIVSGPEPARSDFERALLYCLANQDALIVGGRPDLSIQTKGYSSFMDAMELAKQINEAEYIICRAGYSTLMDLAAYHKKLVLVPTPGQTEQLYLARQIQDKKQGIIWDMHQVTWKTIRSEADQMFPFYIKNDPLLLVHAIEEVERWCSGSESGI